MPQDVELHPGNTHEGVHHDSLAYDEAHSVFQDLIRTSFDTDDLEKWIDKSRVRQDLFGELVVGVIRWPRYLGRPASPQLSDGFELLHRFWADTWHLGVNGPVQDILGWLPGEPPVVRENLSEPEHYSVRYLFYASPDIDEQIEVRFSNVSWQRPGRAVHQPNLYLSSHGFQFHTAGGFMALPTITVANQPFFHP
jgi:hypothetical protein